MINLTMSLNRLVHIIFKLILIALSNYFPSLLFIEKEIKVITLDQNN